MQVNNSAGSGGESAVDYDLKIVNGAVHDGEGNAPLATNVAVRNGLIVEGHQYSRVGAKLTYAQVDGAGQLPGQGIAPSFHFFG